MAIEGGGGGASSAAARAARRAALPMLCCAPPALRRSPASSDPFPCANLATSASGTVPSQCTLPTTPWYLTGPHSDGTPQLPARCTPSPPPSWWAGPHLGYPRPWAPPTSMAGTQDQASAPSTQQQGRLHARAPRPVQTDPSGWARERPRLRRAHLCAL